jgi:hypothetical protein
MITVVVVQTAEGQDLGRTELDAESTAFAAILIDVHAAPEFTCRHLGRQNGPSPEKAFSPMVNGLTLHLQRCRPHHE